MTTEEVNTLTEDEEAIWAAGVLTGRLIERPVELTYNGMIVYDVDTQGVIGKKNAIDLLEGRPHRYDYYGEKQGWIKTHNSGS